MDHRPNLCAMARRYLNRLGLGVENPFHRILAILHDRAYSEANVGVARMEWSHLPLPNWPDGGDPRRIDGAGLNARRAARS